MLLCSKSSQGLFHPARKVREVYWKIYNTLYIGSQVESLLIGGEGYGGQMLLLPLKL